MSKRSELCMPTLNLDRLADEGMLFTSFYAQPSRTPGRAAMQTGAFRTAAV
jgi:arylsulfatase A-like enzyme